MMSKIYDFGIIPKISAQQKRLVYSYIGFVILFAAALAIACVSIKSNLLLTIIFAVFLLCFILGSILFWKIKYGILKKYKMFLDNIETGNKEDFVGEFSERLAVVDDDECEVYIFESMSKKTGFLVHKQHSMDLIKGKRYHLECVGNYMYQWEDNN